MKVKFGAIVVDGRNKIGGHVMSKNRAGSYMRTKVTPVNPRTTYQSSIRNRLSSISIAWRGLLAANILAWNSAVDQWKQTDIFGDLKKPSGFNLHQRLNNNAMRVGGAALTVPPVPVALSSLGATSVAAAEGASIAITCALQSLGANEVLEVMATPALSPGIGFAKNHYRIITSAAALTAGVYDAYTVYSAKYGDVGAAGDKIFVQVRIVNSVTGQASIPRAAYCAIS